MAWLDDLTNSGAEYHRARSAKQGDKLTAPNGDAWVCVRVYTHRTQGLLWVHTGTGEGAERVNGTIKPTYEPIELAEPRRRPCGRAGRRLAVSDRDHAGVVRGRLA